MKTVYPILANNPHVPKCGDLICDFDGTNTGKFLESAEEDKFNKFEYRFDDKQILPLALLNPNPFHSLTILNIDFNSILSSYSCPYTKYDFYSIVPTALISDDLAGKYGSIKHWNKEYLFDYDWHKKMMGDRILELSEIGNLMLGSGYTGGTGFNDGHSSKHKTTVNLDNGDQLCVYFLEWHNK